MKFVNLLSFLGLFVLCIENAYAWDQEEFEIFDLVEEINENFYSILKVNQVCFISISTVFSYF